MTFPWARILLMLIIVGLCSIFLTNSRVLALASMPFDSYHSYSCSYDQDLTSKERRCEPQSNTYSDTTFSSIENANVDLSTVLSDTLTDVSSSILDYARDLSSTNVISEPPNSNDVHYVPTYSARYISIAQHQPDETNPNYVLAYEFVSPPVPSLTIGYQINFSPQLDWTLSTASAPSRLSAWKESNLLFVHAHTC
ncbi:hypothetical protein [Shewanella sp. MEBiC00475]|uniref:hypothetical protein n=1 Tax=Shewanella sp. MEBiC00475 TaxID=2575361 RepID=UPI0010BFC8AD|nr:hypothetical protein [Shewanella sp. MEBiC00475]